MLGVSEGGPMLALFAATYPERTTALVAMGTFARRLAGARLPDRRADASTRAPRIGGADRARASSRSGRRDRTTRRRPLVRLLHRPRREPGRGAELHEMNCEIDVRHVLPTVGVPRSCSTARTSTSGRHLLHGRAHPGRGAALVSGRDHLPWEGDQDAVLDAIDEFLATVRERARARPHPHHRPAHPRGLGRCRALRGARAQPAAALPRGALGEAGARFDGPARAVRCARALVAAAAARGLDVRAGLHSGESRSPTATRRARRSTSAPRSRRRPGRARCSPPRRCATSSPARASRSSARGALPGSEQYELYSVGTPDYQTATQP